MLILGTGKSCDLTIVRWIRILGSKIDEMNDCYRSFGYGLQLIVVPN